MVGMGRKKVRRELPARFSRSVPLYPGSAKVASNWQVIFIKSLAVLFPRFGFFRQRSGIIAGAKTESNWTWVWRGAESDKLVDFSCLRFPEKRIA